MTKSRFRILGLRFNDSCLISPILQKKMWYWFYSGVSQIVESTTETFKLENHLFADEYLYDTEDVSVSISAIVGKNGCGKSSIIDMMVRMFNNAAAAILGEEVQYAAAEHLHYIENVNGDLLYLQGDELSQLVIEGHDISIKNYTSAKSKDCTLYSLIGNKEWISSKTHSSSKLLPVQKDKFDHLSSFFYSIINNYSIYAYYYNDYYNEATSENKINQLRNKPNLIKFPFQQMWMTGLFHKNDGYQAPIVINPMRVGGVIDGPKENRLGKERLLSLLFYKQGVGEDCKFPFRTINGNLQIEGLYLPIDRRVLSNGKKDLKKWTKDWMIEVGLLQKSSNLCKQYDNCCSRLWEYFNNTYNIQGIIAIDNTVRNFAEAKNYLIYKIIKISLQYKKYIKIIKNLSKESFNDELLKKHLEELLQDNSHITVKLRRTLMYLLYGDKIYPKKTSPCRDIYSLTEIEESIQECVANFNSISSIPFRAKEDDFLPPPIFDFEFRIKRKNVERLIPFWKFSAGERQIAYSISNFAYHLINIDSVWNSSTAKVGSLPLLKYKYVNVIFDEIELYYHPDLQRKYISLLLETIRSIHLKHIEGINIVLSTHSPYILSDIPRSNVLALKDGRSEQTESETFCANIHDLLGQSFFMDYTIGEFAQNQVESIFRLYNKFREMPNDDSRKKCVEENKDKFEYVASKVADEYLKKTIRRMLDEMIDSTETLASIEKKIQLKKVELSQLESKRKELKND